jgi:hypothetical protein
MHVLSFLSLLEMTTHLHDGTTLPTESRAAMVMHNNVALCGFKQNYKHELVTPTSKSILPFFMPFDEHWLIAKCLNAVKKGSA